MAVYYIMSLGPHGRTLCSRGLGVARGPLIGDGCSRASTAKSASPTFQNRKRFLKAEYMPNSSISSDSLKVEMVSPAQSMRDKKKLKFDKF